MEFFNNIEKIKYEGLESNNMLAFRHYNAEEIVMGKPMKLDNRGSNANSEK